MEEARSVKKALALLVALVTLAILSSCIFNPFSNVPAERDRIVQIADAITDQDADALKELFSPRALEQATDIDAQLEYLLSLFPPGSEISHDLTSLEAPMSIEDGRTTEMVTAVYKVTAGGQDLWLFFADYTVNDPEPDKVGLYALGVAPRTELQESEAELAMYEWNGQFALDAGTPGVYVP
jgi:hypothetical protein